MHIIFFVNFNNSLVNEIYYLNKIYIKSYIFVVNQVITLIFIKYSDFANLFFFKFVYQLFKYVRINNYINKFINKWQLFYEPIYSLKIIELEILKTYFKRNLANSFISLFN